MSNFDKLADFLALLRTDRISDLYQLRKELISHVDFYQEQYIEYLSDSETIPELNEDWKVLPVLPKV